MGNTRKLLLSALCAAVCIGLVGFVAAQALGLPRQPGFQSGTLKVEFSDRSGAPMTAPYFNLGHAYPGMAPISTTLTIHNGGSLPATYGVGVGRIRASARSLADLLIFRVKGSSGAVAYQGDLSGLSLRRLGPLAPGATDTYSVEARWPDGEAGANGYQGQSLSFSFLLTADAPTH
jgi:hypothetical protein